MWALSIELTLLMCKIRINLISEGIVWLKIGKKELRKRVLDVKGLRKLAALCQRRGAVLSVEGEGRNSWRRPGASRDSASRSRWKQPVCSSFAATGTKANTDIN